MTDTSDLVEWLERRGNKMSYGGRLVEAATALTAKDKEIEALRERAEYPSTLYQDAEESHCNCGAAGSGDGHTEWCKWRDTEWFTWMSTIHAEAEERVETAEQQLAATRKALGQQTKMASEQFCRANDAERELDEARAVLKPFALLASQYDELRASGECHSWIEFLADFHWPNENQCIAARAVIKQGE